MIFRTYLYVVTDVDRFIYKQRLKYKLKLIFCSSSLFFSSCCDIDIKCVLVSILLEPSRISKLNDLNTYIYRVYMWHFHLARTCSSPNELEFLLP